MTFTIGQEHYCFPSLRGFINFDFSILLRRCGVLRFDSTAVRFTPNFPAFRLSGLPNEFEDIATRFVLLPWCWLPIVHTTREKMCKVYIPTHTYHSFNYMLPVSVTCLFFQGCANTLELQHCCPVQYGNHILPIPFLNFKLFQVLVKPWTIPQGPDAQVQRSLFLRTSGRSSKTLQGIRGTTPGKEPI